MEKSDVGFFQTLLRTSSLSPPKLAKTTEMLLFSVVYCLSLSIKTYTEWSQRRSGQEIGPKLW
jgi:hypothetical protein